MKEVLQDIYIGRMSLDSIEFKYDTIEVPLYKGEDREFQLFVKNFASPTHITFLPDDAIRNYLILVPSKYHILNNEYIKIVVRIPYNAAPAAEGMLYVITGYGVLKKGFKLSVGSNISGGSTLSTGGDLSGIRTTGNPAGDIYKSEGPISNAGSERAQLVYDEDDDDETEIKEKPAFGIKKDWESKTGKSKARQPSSKSGARQPSSKSEARQPSSKSEARQPSSKSETRQPSSESETRQPSSKSDKYGTVKKRPALPVIEKVTVFVSLVLIVLLLALFVFIQFADLESIFPFDHTFLLALIAVGFIIFLVLLLSLFLRRSEA